MFLYETHLHTSPASGCAKVNVKDNLAFYKALGYAGVFITNHFLWGNPNETRSYEERVNYFFADYEEGVKIGREIGLDVLCGAELTYQPYVGTDFLVYGLDKAWFLAHSEIDTLKPRALLNLLRESGMLVVHAHPYREAHYIDHIRLFPRCVHGVEIDNACRTDFENEMAAHYAKSYGLLPFAGSDNHFGIKRERLAGMQSETPITDEVDFVKRVLSGEMSLFSMKNPLLPDAQNG